jgi:hypothetical protein
VSHPAEDPELDELDFVPIEEEPENEALDAHETRSARPGIASSGRTLRE